MANATAKAVDFTNVKDGGGFNRSRIPAGDYLAKIIKVEDAPSKKDQIFQYLFTIQIQKRPSSKLPYYCKLQENQLWKLRNLLIAAGISVPKARQKVDPNKLVGKLIGVTVEDADFDDKEQSEIGGVFPAAELVDSPIDDDDDSGDDEGAPEDVDDDTDLGDLDNGADEEPEEAEEEVEEEPEEEVDPFDPAVRTPLKAAIKKLDASFVAKKSQTNADLQAVLDGLQPKKKTTTKKKAAEVSDEELEELDIDDL